MIVRKLAEHILQETLSDEEFNFCLRLAQEKLERIIRMEGDLGGRRREDSYLALLVAEIVWQSRWTIMSLEEGHIKEKAHHPDQEVNAH